MHYKEQMKDFARGSRVIRAYHSWQYFGTAMLLSKAWEKYVVDKWRFRGNCVRSIPIFASSVHSDEVVSVTSTSKQINICYLLHYFYPDKQGGTERFVLNLAKWHQRAGNRVRVIALGKRPLKQYRHREGDIFWEEFDFEGIPVTQIRYRKAPRGLYYDRIDLEEPSMTQFAEWAIGQYAPDIVHFAYPQPFGGFAKECMKHNIPYIVTLTDFNIFCHYATMVCKNGTFCDGCRKGAHCQKRCKTYGVKDFYQRYQNGLHILKVAAYITAPSRFVANVVEQEFQKMQVRVIPHGIEEHFFPFRERKRTRTFLYAGTLSEMKGIHLLIKAFQNIPGDSVLLICGGGELSYVNSLNSLACKDKRIHFCGEIPAGEMAEVYQKADCVVVPSIWYETYNFVLREGLSSGCIGIASNLGAMPEAIVEGKNGFTFEAGNLRALCEALDKAINFDWNNYQKQTFPQITDEALQYQLLYQRVT